MKTKDVMMKNVVTIAETATYEAAVTLLVQSEISGAPVIDAKGNLVGMISEKDLFKALYPSYQDFSDHPDQYLNFEDREAKVEEVRKRPISQFMTRTMATVTPHTPLLKAGALMLAHNTHRLPVVEGSKVVGIVTRDHIYKAVIQNRLSLS